MPTRMAIKKNTFGKITSVGEDVDKLDPSNITGGNVQWCSYHRKQFGDFSVG